MGRFYGMLSPICETFTDLSYLMGRRPMKDVLGNHSKGPIIPFGSLAEYHPIICEGPFKNPSIWSRKSYLDMFLGYALYAVRIWKGDAFWSQTLRSWRRWTHRKINSKKTQCERKRDDFRKEKGELHFSNRRWNESKPLEEIKTSENIYLGTPASTGIQGESNIDFLGESEGSLPTPPQDDSYRGMPEEGMKVTFCPCHRKLQKTAITLNLESNFTRRERNHPLFH